MNIERLRKAIVILKDSPVELSAQSLTYLRTYKSLLDAVSIMPRHPESLLSQVAVLAYGWMPRVTRLDSAHYSEASEALVSVASATGKNCDPFAVKKISECLHSVVGASKVLHFVRPDTYPIWDSKVARVWYREVLSQAKMSSPTEYIDYARKIHQLAEAQNINEFLQEFGAAYSARLIRLLITDYVLSPIRAIEAAAFELSGGEYEDA